MMRGGQPIIATHTPTTTAIKPPATAIKTSNKWRRLGFISVRPDSNKAHLALGRKRPSKPCPHVYQCENQPLLWPSHSPSIRRKLFRHCPPQRNNRLASGRRHFPPARFECRLWRAWRTGRAQFAARRPANPLSFRKKAERLPPSLQANSFCLFDRAKR